MNDENNQNLVGALDRIGNVLGVLCVHLLGDVDLSVKANHLSRCGFSNKEIAVLLGSTGNSINVALHRARHTGRTSKKKNRLKRKM